MNQQEQFVPEGQQDAAPQAETNAQFTPTTGTAETDYSTGWSWGGFMFNLYFAIAVRKYAYLWLFFLNLIPYLGTLVMMIIFGMKGRELAATSRTFDNKEQSIGFIKAMDHAGKIVFFILLCFIALVVFLGLSFATMMSNEFSGARDRAEEAARMQDSGAIDMDQDFEDMRRELERMDY